MVRKLGRHEPTQISPELALHLIAAAYGQSPAAVRAWPVADFVMARAALEVTLR